MILECCNSDFEIKICNFTFVLLLIILKKLSHIILSDPDNSVEAGYTLFLPFTLKETELHIC